MKSFFSIVCASFLLIGCSESIPEQTAITESNETQSLTPPTVEENVSTQTSAPVVAVGSEATKTVDAVSLFTQKCASCHGIKAEKAALGKSQVIATLSEAQIKEALTGYQAQTYGKEMKALMQGQVKGFNEEQINALAKYITEL